MLNALELGFLKSALRKLAPEERRATLQQVLRLLSDAELGAAIAIAQDELQARSVHYGHPATPPDMVLRLG